MSPWCLRRSFVLAFAVFATMLPAFLLVNTNIGNFLTTRQVFIATAYTTALTVSMLSSWFDLLAILVIVPHIGVFGLVNPIDRGLKVVESAPLFRLVQGTPDLRRHRWIVYSDSVPDSGFLTAVGCDVVTGLDYVPDAKALGAFDPEGTQRDLLNSTIGADPAAL